MSHVAWIVCSISSVRALVGGRTCNGPTYITVSRSYLFHVTCYSAALPDIHYNLPDYAVYGGVGATTPSADVRYEFFGFGWVRRVHWGCSFGANPSPPLALGVLYLLKCCPITDGFCRSLVLFTLFGKHCSLTGRVVIVLMYKQLPLGIF